MENFICEFTSKQYLLYLQYILLLLISKYSFIFTHQKNSYLSLTKNISNLFGISTPSVAAWDRAGKGFSLFLSLSDCVTQNQTVPSR